MPTSLNAPGHEILYVHERGDADLPSWLDSIHAVEAGIATPLQRLIADYEPCSRERREDFRALLQKALSALVPGPPPSF